MHRTVEHSTWSVTARVGKNIRGRAPPGGRRGDYFAPTQHPPTDPTPSGSEAVLQKKHGFPACFQF